MVFDITKLSEDELLELNRRVVERLQFIRSAKSLAQLARFSVGMAVEATQMMAGRSAARWRVSIKRRQPW
jgi:hypothetical protein